MSEQRSKNYWPSIVTKASQDFLDGQTDCMNGIPADVSRSEQYKSGYADWYAYEQEMTEKTKNAR